MCKDVHHNPLKKSGVDIKGTQQRTTTGLSTDERSPGPGRKVSSLAKVLFQSAKLQTPISVSQNVDIQHLTPNLSPLNPRPKVCRRTDLNYKLHLRLFLHESITYTRQTHKESRMTHNLRPLAAMNAPSPKARGDLRSIFWIA